MNQSESALSQQGMAANNCAQQQYTQYGLGQQLYGICQREHMDSASTQQLLNTVEARIGTIRAQLAKFDELKSELAMLERMLRAARDGER